MADNHIITAKYNRDGYTRTRVAYQYDYGQVLKLDGFGDMLPNAFEMHFSIGGGEAITRIGQNGEVGKILYLDAEQILPNPDQPRRVFSQPELEELASSTSRIICEIVVSSPTFSARNCRYPD